MRRIAGTLGGFALITLTIAPALAHEAKAGTSWQVGNDSMHVYYTDLDMTSAAGRAALLARITRAAERLCRERVDQRGCIADTVRNTPAPALRLALAERDGVQVAGR